MARRTEATLDHKEQRRSQVKAAISTWLASGALESETESFRLEYAADIPRTTFYNWLRKARIATAAPAQAARLEAVKQAAPARAVQALVEVLPTPVDVLGAVSRFGGLDAIQIVHESIGHAQAVIRDLCSGTDGKTKNGKMLLAAAASMTRSVDVLVRVAERYYDVQRIERINTAMIEEVRCCDPATAERILGRISDILAKNQF